MSTQDSMRQIHWNETFSVGDDMLDKHHQHMARLINQVGGMESEDAHSEPLVDVLSSLVKYVEYHFEHEERLMAQLEYRELESHRQEHVHFCEVVAEICFGASLGIISARDLFSYLTRWWRNHILIEDMKYKPLLIEASLEAAS